MQPKSCSIKSLAAHLAYCGRIQEGIGTGTRCGD
jgi:hypothetical protein